MNKVFTYITHHLLKQSALVMVHSTGELGSWCTWRLLEPWKPQGSAESCQELAAFMRGATEQGHEQ